MASLESRIKGCLIGAAIGAELGFAQSIHPDWFAVSDPKDVFGVKLEPDINATLDQGGLSTQKSLRPFINLGVQSYLQKQGRATPEDLGALLKDDEEISSGIFLWDYIHTVQEVLKEGMNPRISALGLAPSGLIAAAMPAVGIFHFNDPEFAYLDGVELASVAQPRLGADWAALCAAAIAAAFNADSNPAEVVTAVLKLAHENNKDVFYQINRVAWGAGSNDEEFAAWWLGPGRGEDNIHTSWPGYNPIRYVLPVLARYASDAKKFFALLLTHKPASSLGSWMYIPAHAIIGGAILGALHGVEAFPSEWRKWAEPIASSWFPLADLVNKRQKQEQTIVSTIEKMISAKGSEGSLLEDKVYGCMLAGAIGNAMGSSTEGMSYQDIDKNHPGGITTVLDPSRLEGEDDNQMAMHLVETYIDRASRPVLARHFGKTWYERLNRDHFYTMCMGHAYDLIRQGWDPRITGHWSVVTGSTVMCMEPVGVYHALDPEFAAIDAMAISYMYQRGLDVVAATMLAATVAEAMRPEATVDSVLQAALDVAPKEPMLTFDKRSFVSAHDYISACLEIASKYDDVMAVRKELCDKCLFYSAIDPLELWGFSLAMLKISKGDIRQAAIGGTNIGRDADTIAGRAAMLAGTLNGPSGVPAEWMALFKPEVLARIKTNASRFAKVVEMKLERMKKRTQ